MIETWGVPALVAAADAAAKTADVRVTAYDKADAGLVTVYIRGDVASVKAAVEAGSEAARRVGKLISAHVIPRPDAGIDAMIRPDPGGTAPASARGNMAGSGMPDLDALPVQELRRLARSTPGFPLLGRQISTAGRAELLRLLKEKQE
ncbi:BMC domain-containing protein [Cohnella sp. CFH 77786]|nr:BMC domain-containing protein [Cohnella sp. CFH 77786]